MRTSGIASEKPMTLVVCLVAVGFLVMLAGGPSEFMHLFQQTVDSAAASVMKFAQHLRS